VYVTLVTEPFDDLGGEESSGIAVDEELDCKHCWVRAR